jgi:predicted O-methyltransferase YrrM
VTAQQLIESIYASKTVETASGEKLPLHSGITEASGPFLRSLIQQYHCRDVLEIGLAFGLSALFIEDALSAYQPARHVLLDPVQMTAWHGVGVANLKRAGCENFELIEEYSEFALPAMLKAGRQFDFAFIDGWHTMDHALLDFFYINRMLKDGGIVVFDDARYRSVRKAIMYVSNYPNYRYIGSDGTGGKPGTVGASVKKIAQKALRPMAASLFDSVPPKDLPAGRMMAFQKTGPDQRRWDWFVPF